MRERQERPTCFLSSSEMTSCGDTQDLQTLMDGVIGEDYIVRETGMRDLSSIYVLKLKIDTSIQSIFELSEIVPNLKKLDLTGSNILTVRDLGVGLKFITSLSLASCGLSDVDGIGALVGLEDLCLRNNLISDVTPLAMHERVQTLDLSGNSLSDVGVGDALSSCPRLKSLDLSRNPLSKATNYRLIIASLVPGISLLDGSPIDTAAAQKKVTNGMILEAASYLRLMQEEIDDEKRLEDELVGGAFFPNGGSTSASSAAGIGGSSSANSGSNRDSDVSSFRSKEAAIFPDTGSDLTHGSSVVLAGGMAAAMRKRRNKLLQPIAGCAANNGALSPSSSSSRALGEESALDVIDSFGAKRKGGVSCGQEGHSSAHHQLQFLSEGDITSSVLGDARSAAAMARGSPKKPTSLKIRTGVEYEGGDVVVNTFDGSETAFGGVFSGDGLLLSKGARNVDFSLNAASPQVSSRSNRQPQDFGHAPGGGMESGFSSRNSSRPHTAQSAFTPSKGDEYLLDGASSGAAGGFSSARGLSSPSPSPSPWMMRASSGSSRGNVTVVSRPITPAAGGVLGANSSPRQRNSSRPQSAASIASTASEIDRDDPYYQRSLAATFAAPGLSVPFKIAIDDAEKIRIDGLKRQSTASTIYASSNGLRAGGRGRVAGRGSNSADFEIEGDDEDGGSGDALSAGLRTMTADSAATSVAMLAGAAERAKKKASRMMDEDDSDDDGADVDDLAWLKARGRTADGAIGGVAMGVGVSSSVALLRGGKASIVHRDMVIRRRRQESSDEPGEVVVYNSPRSGTNTNLSTPVRRKKTGSARTGDSDDEDEGDDDDVDDDDEDHAFSRRNAHARKRGSRAFESQQQQQLQDHKQKHQELVCSAEDVKSAIEKEDTGSSGTNSSNESGAGSRRRSHSYSSSRSRKKLSGARSGAAVGISEDVDDDDDADDGVDRDDGDEDSLSSDVEEIAVNHSSRFRLMSASGSRKSSAPTDVLARVAAATAAANAGSTAVAAAGNMASVGIRAGGVSSRAAPMTSRPPKYRAGGGGGGSGAGGGITLGIGDHNYASASSKAGKSLGFNLEGSLAAIDKWVKDMSSDDEEEDEEDEENDAEQMISTARLRSVAAAGTGAGAASALSAAASGGGGVRSRYGRYNSNSGMGGGASDESIGVVNAAGLGSLGIGTSASSVSSTRCSSREDSFGSGDGLICPSSRGSSRNNSARSGTMTVAAAGSSGTSAAGGKDRKDLSSRILSRDTIITMCSNSQREVAGSFSTSSAIAGGSGGGGGGGSAGVGSERLLSARNAKITAEDFGGKTIGGAEVLSLETPHSDYSYDYDAMLAASSASTGSGRHAGRNMHGTAPLSSAVSSSHDSISCSGGGRGGGVVRGEGRGVGAQQRLLSSVSSTSIPSTSSRASRDLTGQNQEEEHRPVDSSAAVAKSKGSKFRSSSSSLPLPAEHSNSFQPDAAKNGSQTQSTIPTGYYDSASSAVDDRVALSSPAGSDMKETAVFGPGVFSSDVELVELLKRPPKATMVLRTKANFQEYFRGISARRMQGLLEQAYADLGGVDSSSVAADNTATACSAGSGSSSSNKDRALKVKKRMDLLSGLTTA